MVDLGWSDDVVALGAERAGAAAYAGRFVDRAGRLPERQSVGAAALHQRGGRAPRGRGGRRPQSALGASVREDDPQPGRRAGARRVDPAGRRPGGRRAGLPVVAHCQGPGMVELALAGGVAALAHTPWTHRLDDEVVAEAVEAGQAWVSTLDIHGYGTPSADQDRAVDNLARFHAAGGRVLYGTDLGNGPLPETLNLREVGLLVDAGLYRRRPAGGADRPLAVRRPRRTGDRGARRAGAAGSSDWRRTRRTRRRSMVTDPLASYRDRFVGADVRPRLLRRQLARPAADGDRPAAGARSSSEEWGGRLIRGWDERWFDLPAARSATRSAGSCLGAAPGQVAVGDSTTVLLYKLMRAAVAARPGRTEIVIDRDNFPTDRYVADGRRRRVRADPALDRRRPRGRA